MNYGVNVTDKMLEKTARLVNNASSTEAAAHLINHPGRMILGTWSLVTAIIGGV